MTLVVARTTGKQIAMAADTLLTEHGKPLSFKNGTVKICILPANICIGFSNSPELAERDIAAFMEIVHENISFEDTVIFFENSSFCTGNEYIIAFGRSNRLVKITNGRRVCSKASTVWIGDKDAYESFRQIDSRRRRRSYQGRAINCTIFGDEPEDSPASNLYSAMMEVANDKKIPTVGGFICVASHRGFGFRFSLYSDILFDWPNSRPDTNDIDLNEKIRLRSTDENINYSISQIPSLYLDANYVGFYILSGKMLFIFNGTNNGLANKCFVITDLEPPDIYQAICKTLGLDLRWLVLIMSSYDFGKMPYQNNDISEIECGVQLGMFCHANTCPKDTGLSGLLRFQPSH